MSITVELPNGGTATLRDPATVTERQRRPVVRLQLRLAGSTVGQLLAVKDSLSSDDFDERMRKLMGSEDYALLDELNDALMVALVERADISGTTYVGEALLDVPGGAYDVLRTECAKHQSELLPSFGPNPDEESPTPPSDSSPTT